MEDILKIKKIKLTKSNLKKIMEIDSTFYIDDVLSIKWYLERYNKNHSATILMNSNKDYVGYIVSVPIKKELYDALLNGVLINDLYINPKMYSIESKYYYIVSCVILKKYRGLGYGKILMNSVLNNLNNNYIALAISKDGKRLASKYMKEKLIINKESSIFVKGGD